MKHVIITDFNYGKKENQLKKHYCFEKYAEKCFIVLCQNLVEGKTVQNAFNLARKVALTSLCRQKYFDADNIDQVLSLIGGEGSILLPKDKSHDEVLFQNNELPIGNVVNISKIHYNNQVY